LLIEIFKHTPSWVFVLFFILVALGYFQTKERKVTRGKVAILPVVMIALSFFGVFSAFGMPPVGIFSWVVGIALTVWLGAKLNRPHGVSFSPETRLLSVPGSWLPLALMMAIFSTKYMVGVVQARQLPVIGNPVFIGAIGLCYGIFSGIFLARAVVIWRAAGRLPKSPV
jgi:hypothetical protein